MKTEWIVLKYDVSPNIMICNRCKKEQVMPEGNISMNMLIAIGECFTKEHKDCKLGTENGN